MNALPHAGFPFPTDPLCPQVGKLRRLILRTENRGNRLVHPGHIIDEQRHRRTGRKTLYVNSGFTTRIKGMRPAESRATLAFLFQHIQSPDFQCRFQWRANSIAFWDNRCVQHYATWDYFPQKRHGYRVTIAGERPF